MVGTPVSSPEILQEFVNGGADVHAKTRWGGYTALIHASLRGDTEAVKFLLEHGADPNVRNDRGWTALTQLQGFPEIIRLLKKAGGKR